MSVKALVPKGVRSYIRRVQQRLAVRDALEPLRTNGKFSEVELERFYRAWGNEGFAADKDFLRVLLTHLETGPVLECGTGGTTLLADVMGIRNGFSTYCLEQDPEWLKPAKMSLWPSRAARLFDTPLKNYGTHLWYDVREPLPQHFALIVCDGPYIDKNEGEPYFSAWRYGVLPWLKDHNKTWDVMLLDDMNDPRAEAIVDRWVSEFGLSIQRIASAVGICGILRPN